MWSIGSENSLAFLYIAQVIYYIYQKNLETYLGLHLNDIDINLDAFGIYFNQLLKKYQGSYIRAIAAYNAGPKSVDRWIGWYSRHLNPIEFVEIIPYKETRRYTKAVLFNAFMYGSLYDYDVSEILKEVIENGKI